MSYWQPIETAPKDGRPILLFIWGVIRIAAWEPHADGRYPFVWKTPDGDVLVRPWKEEDEPTHWMTLPKPPLSPELMAAFEKLAVLDAGQLISRIDWNAVAKTILGKSK